MISDDARNRPRCTRWGCSTPTRPRRSSGLPANAEVRALAEELREAAGRVWRRRSTGVSGSPPGLRTRVLAEIARQEAAVARPAARGDNPTPGKVVQGPWVGEGRVLPWAAAAVLMICCGALAVSREHGRREIASLRSEAVGLRRESEQWRMSALATPAPTDALRQVAFCPLEPVKAASLPRASVLWDAEHHKGKLRITRLPPPGKGKDYELWVVEDGRKEPVSAGVVTLRHGRQRGSALRAGAEGAGTRRWRSR